MARSIWLGKTLWYRGRELLSYDANTDGVAAVMLRRYSPVTVIDIVAGWSNTNPVRFIIRTADGAEGFADVNLSGTNVEDGVREPNFGVFFLTADPKKTHAWSPEVWAAIDSYQVFVGMTAEQVRMSLGNPKEINTTVTATGKKEQWVYPLTYTHHTGENVYVENGIVTAVQF